MPEPSTKIDGAQAEHLAAHFAVHCTHKPGGVRLDGFPLLAYGPEQWGADKGVHTEDNGTPVHAIATQAATMPDYVELAKHFKTTAEHVRQAIAYAVQASTPAPAKPAPTAPAPAPAKAKS